MSPDVKEASQHYDWIKQPLLPSTPLTVRTCPRFSARNLVSLMETLILAVPMHPALAEVAITTQRPNIAAKVGDILFWLYTEYYSAVRVDAEKGPVGKNDALLIRKDEIAARASEITNAIATLGPEPVLKLWRLLNTFSPSFVLLTADLGGADAAEPTSEKELEASKKMTSLRVGTKFVEYVVSAEASRDALANDKLMFKHATPADKAADVKAFGEFQTMLADCVKAVASPKKAPVCKAANDVQKEFIDRINTAYGHLETIAKEANADADKDNKGKAKKPDEPANKVPSLMLAKKALDDIKKILGKDKPECKLKSKSPDALANIFLAPAPTAEEMILRDIKPVDGAQEGAADDQEGNPEVDDVNDIDHQQVLDLLAAHQQEQDLQQLPEGAVDQPEGALPPLPPQQLPQADEGADQLPAGEGQYAGDDDQQQKQLPPPAALPSNAFIEMMLADQQ